MKLSVVIVNYNVQYFLEQALLSVRKAASKVETEVFVVDNNSVDDSVAMVKEKFPEVTLITNENNPGFAIANNQAIRQSEGEYVLLLNPDTVVEEDTFQKCIQFMDNHPDAGGLGIKMIDGSGRFLPESKRGFPTPFVAFCKTFGLSKLFPKSKTFNHYHLGYLDEGENHEIEVMAGAFMLLRKSALDAVGLLDEAFFMYGEDIDLSYRLVQGGYKNYYLADSTIIHYKGESTKKGSLNYVRTFYNAMIIFARKHFKGEQAGLFVLMLKVAIYFRAFISLVNRIIKKIYLPLFDAILIIIGLYFLKDFWALYYFKNPSYYSDSFMLFNVPLYSSIWLLSVYFSGGYDEEYNLRKLARGILVGTVLLAAVYGFLDLEYRSSRILIILGALWALLSTVSLRVVLHFLKYKNLKVGREATKNLLIVGTKAESERVLQLIHQAQVQKNFIGTVAPNGMDEPQIFLSELRQLDEVVSIYKIDEIIFCSKDVSSQEIIDWMTRIGPKVDFKIVPKESLSIIGSSSKNRSGELYTIDIQFQIAQAGIRRNKRMLDLIISFICLLFIIPLLFIVKNAGEFIKNIFKVMMGSISWVGYHPINDDDTSFQLPSIRKGVLTPLDELKSNKVNEETVKRLNFLYAKDYTGGNDLDIILAGIKNMGRKV